MPPYIGEEALAKSQFLRLRHAVQNGLIADWESINNIWHHSYYKCLKAVPSEHPCLMAENSKNPKQLRQRTLEIMFESYGVPAFYSIDQALLTSYSVGNTTGLVLESGHGLTQVAPIFDNTVMKVAVVQNKLAGQLLNREFRKAFNEKNIRTDSLNDQTIEQIKESLCYVALNYEAQLQNYKQFKKHRQIVYELPDRQKICIGSKMFRWAQGLFKPLIIGQQEPGMHELLHECISRCDQDLRKEMYKNIVLSGGNTLYSGFPEKLKSELSDLAPQTIKIKVIAPQDRKNSVWRGGSILTSLSTFENKWIWMKQYQEYGASIVTRKYF